MWERKLLWLVAALLIVLFGLIVVANSAWIVPELPLKTILWKTSWPLILFTAVLIMIFKVLDYYYLQLHQQVHNLAKLHQSLIHLNTNLSLEHRCTEALSILMELTRAAKGLFLLTDEALKKYTATEFFSITRSNPRPFLFSHYRYQIYSPGRISDQHHQLVEQLIKNDDFTSFPSVLIVPFYNEKKTIALAIIGSNHTDRKILQELNALISILVSHVVTSFENSLLHEEVNESSITDPLTSLYNRRYFRSRLKTTFAEARRIGYPVSVMISDLDNFKKYVDAYGHPRGDLILAEVASLVKKAVRTSDVVCRFGGDEFAYILPYATSEEAKVVADRVRKAIASSRFQNSPEDEPVYLTLSLGIASFPQHGETEEELLKAADTALFWAKSQGKDKTIIYHQVLEVNNEV